MLTEHGLFPVDSLWAEMGRAGRLMQVEGGGLRTQDGRGMSYKQAEECKEGTLV